FLEDIRATSSLDCDGKPATVSEEVANLVAAELHAAKKAMLSKQAARFFTKLSYGKGIQKIDLLAETAGKGLLSILSHLLSAMEDASREAVRVT
ncbi:unnamed protein product, partial [Amoebophrya sp. A25]